MGDIESCGCESEPHTCEDQDIADLERQIGELREDRDRTAEQVVARDAALDACAARIAELLSEVAEWRAKFGEACLAISMTEAERNAAHEEIERLRALISTPRTDEWIESVRFEAAHQIDRWGVEHDAGKRTEDWIALLVYLLGKATRAHYEGDLPKLLHHIISTSAALLNWHRAATGDDTRMRPGVGPRADEIAALETVLAKETTP